MRPLLVVVGLLLAPVLTSAQVTVERAADEVRVADDDRAADSTSLPVQATFAGVRPVDDSTALAQARPGVPPSQGRPVVGPPLPDPTLSRRRGSMVGYIDDAVVGSKIRIRFETGLHNRAPDRAEFFYAKCGCYQDLAKNNAAYDPAAPGPRPNAVGDLNFQQLYVQGEYGITSHFSAFAELPTRWIQPQAFLNSGSGFANHAGIGDVRAGVKLAAIADARQTVTLQLEVFLPTGKASNGLGTDHSSFQPELLLYHQLSDRLVLESQIGDWHPFGGAAGVPTSSSDKFSGDVFFYGIGPSYEVYRKGSVRFAPIVELVGWRVISGLQTGGIGDASGTNIVNLKIGARTSWTAESSLYVGYGHALTTASWYEDIVRVEYRYSF